MKTRALWPLLVLVVLCSSCSLVAGPGDFEVVDGGDGADAAVDAGDDAPAECDEMNPCVGDVVNGSLVCESGTCVPLCDDGFDDCDGLAATGCEVSLQDNADHCGECGNRCSADNAASSCQAGVCQLECFDGFENCDSDTGNGCEADLTSPAACGACTTMCSDPDPLCVDQGAGVFECGPNCGALTDCDSSCVDTTMSIMHCGACGNACTAPERSVPLCTDSACDFECQSGFGDCNDDAVDGCEASLMEVANCGACGNTCEGGNASWACNDMACAPTCDTGFANCNMGDADGCEVDTLTDANHCGGCGNVCDGECVDGVCDPVAEVVGGGQGLSCLRRRSGKILCWSLNTTSEEVGDGTVYPRALPTQVRIDASTPLVGTAMAATTYSACAISSGEIYCWGESVYGQTGDPRSNKAFATLLTGNAEFNGETFADIACGSWTCYAIDSMARVWVWGRNLEGQFGTGTVTPGSSGEPLLIGVSNATEVVAGSNHGCALIDDGTVQCFGWNRYGETTGAPGVVAPRDAGVTSVTELVASGGHTCVVNATGELRCWGRNSGRCFGIENETDYTAPVLSDVANVRDIATGSEHVCGYVSDQPRCWGRQNSGQLGNGFTSGSSATAIPQLPEGIGADARFFARGNQTYAIENSRAWAWGLNTYGQLAVDEAVARPIPSTPLAGLSDVTELSTAYAVATRTHHGCAISGGDLYCWGWNNNGQLGVGNTIAQTTSAPTLVTLTTVTAVSTGPNSSMAISGGEAYAWGFNGDGRLGDGTETNRSSPVLVDLAGSEDEVGMGLSHACARQGSRVYCWGDDGEAQLGRGVAVAGGKDVTPGEEVVMISDATQLSVGSQFSCVVRADGTVSCWGRGNAGQLGSGTANSNSPLAVAGVANALEVSAGSEHACAISRAAPMDTAGQVVCWGRNASGQAGQAPIATVAPSSVPGMTNAVQVRAYSTHSCALLDDDSVWCWGSNNEFQLGNGVESDSVMPVQVPGLEARALSHGHINAINMCAARTDGTGVCWGACWTGGCGTGEPFEYNMPTEMRGL